MSDKYFLDTNILVYSLESTSKKQSISQSLILTSISSGNGVISTQVVQEFLNLAMGKFAEKTSSENTREFMQKVLFPLCQVYTDFDLFSLALEIQTETRYAFYDSMILAAALQGGCHVLYSEDMQSGHKVRGLEIINPYLPGIKLPE